MTPYTVEQLENLIYSARINLEKALSPRQTVGTRTYKRSRRVSFTNNPTVNDIDWMRKRLANLEKQLKTHPNYIQNESAA